ncbi:MAG: hypothetical protein DRQ02_01235 [Candidatus Latescibacterota bacterium]|nr:MAG: hypothetical protein DRQ24_12260 [Candidatus Latescibacterota bacterium]RKY69373.1 MAG: hypothetical protein DRQ02_01235 [Candidatus Latescibacterota bacterium]
MGARSRHQFRTHREQRIAPVRLAAGLSRNLPSAPRINFHALGEKSVFLGSREALSSLLTCGKTEYNLANNNNPVHGPRGLAQTVVEIETADRLGVVLAENYFRLACHSI